MEINENTMFGDVVETFEAIDLMVLEFFDFRNFFENLFGTSIDSLWKNQNFTDYGLLNNLILGLPYF